MCLVQKSVPQDKLNMKVKSGIEDIDDNKSDTLTLITMQKAI